MKALKYFYSKFVTPTLFNKDDNPDIKEWRNFLGSIPPAKNAYELSYHKYLCRKHYFSKLQRFMLNAAALGILVMKNPIFMMRRGEKIPESSNSLLFEKRSSIPYKDIVPEQATENFDFVTIIEAGDYQIGRLCSETLKHYLKIRRLYPFEFYFSLIVLRELSLHTHYLIDYKPQTVIVYDNERNDASPIITNFYETKGRQFISFMHGDHNIQLTSAFQQYSSYYVWDEYYVDLFTNDLMCAKNQFKVYKPRRLTKKWHCEFCNPDYNYTYYCSGESESSISAMADALRLLESYGYRCKVRPHPRATDIEYLRNVIDDLYIEDPYEVDMRTSLENTQCAIGLISTALSEAFVEGRTVVVDDVSDPERYKSVVERRSIILERPHSLLSEILVAKK